MKAFHTVAIPHKDILEGRLTMDVFAADLWEVNEKRGPDEYKDRDTFFRKTYLTQGLDNLLEVVARRLRGDGGDPVIQIQTPFGGGKTHALIAMFHKAKEWDAKKIVISGTAASAQDTLWGLIEQQLTGKIDKLSTQIAPGKESIRALLLQHEPLLILIDEVLEYVTKAAGVIVGESNLAAQTMAFMQELTEVSSTLEKVCCVVTLPSSIIEHYDEKAERLFQQLQKVAGRVEKIYTPVQENEITHIIRSRLFSDIDKKSARDVVAKFIDYAEKEGIVPVGMEPSEYRERFINAYPFLPDVVDILYHRWGSFPTFQRTRGVLRLLSLVVYSLRGSNIPYISLADFDLANQEIRQELLKHIGAEFNSIIAADITDATAGAKRVDASLGQAYQGLKLGSRAAASIFLYSFSGAQEQGVTQAEVKRCGTTIANPASVVAEAVEQLNNELFFIQKVANKYFFSNQPNINRIRLVKMENIKEEELIDEEKDLLLEGIKGGKLKTFLWEQDSSSIADSEDLKLVIIKKKSQDMMKHILENKGQTPRVYRNTIFFFYPLESERVAFMSALKRKIADEYIDTDKNIALSDEQKKEIKKEVKKADAALKESIRRFYRMISIPHKDGFKEIDLGIPTYGEERELSDEVYEKLRSDGEVLEKVAPLVLKEKYLTDKDYVLTEQVYQSSIKTPGETRPINKTVFEEGIAEGVQMGLFGIGELKEEKPICRNFKEHSSVALSGNEVIIREELCKEQKEKEKEVREVEVSDRIPEEEVESKGGEIGIRKSVGEKDAVYLRFRVPKGKVAQIMGVMNLLQSKFETLEVSLTAKEGSISQQDYEEKIEEAFSQLGIKLDDA